MVALDYQAIEKDWKPNYNGHTPKSQTDSVRNAGSWESIIQKISGFEHLKIDWDGLGAEAPSRELVNSAIGLAYLLIERGVDPPHSVVPGTDGSVNFEWQYSDGSIRQIEIDEPFHAEVMLMHPGKPAEFWTLP